MSRIHDALLRAQQEEEIRHEILDIENLPLTPLGDSIQASGEVVGIRAPVGIADESSADSIMTDALPSFARHTWEPDVEKLVFMKPGLASGIEEFRMLRARLLRECTQRQLKTILITAATAAEGKTFVAANLALAMSRHPGSRVLLIDADLRRSSLHTVFGIAAVPGLSEYLSGAVDEAALVMQTPEPQLCIVRAGKYSLSPTELLHSHRMRQLIENMGRCFDWIFIDSPPAGVFSDSAVLSEICDAAVVVIATGTPLGLIKKARNEFGSKVVGVVLNRAEGHIDRYGYYSSEERSKNLRKSNPAVGRKLSKASK